MDTSTVQEIKIPCEECISLAMCVAGKEIRCTILLRNLDKSYEKSKYPEWGNIIDHTRKVLRGNWCTVGINASLIKLQKDRKEGYYDFE